MSTNALTSFIKENGCIVVAEGYLFELERRGYLKAGPFVPEVVLKHPDAVFQLHKEFIRAGSDATVAFTYYGHRAKMRVAGLEGQLEELNLQALALARKAADEMGGLVAGNICNTWQFDPADPEGSDPNVRAIFAEQVGWAKDSGADFIIAETFSHLGEARIALQEIQKAGLPAVITFVQVQPETCDGINLAEACRILSEEGADVVGLNCGRGPETMLPTLAEIRANVKGHVAALPVPYRTTVKEPTFFQLRRKDNTGAFPAALDPFLLDRIEIAEFTKEFRELGIDYIGLCCGAAPNQIRAMAEALGRTVPASEYSPDLTHHATADDGGAVALDHYRQCFGIVE